MNVMFSSQTDNWATPQWLFDKLDKIFSFSLDPCASVDNAKCKKFYTKEEDGLQQDWGGRKCFAILHMEEKFRFGLKSALMKCIQETALALSC